MTSEPVRFLVCRGHETITELTSHDRCNSDQEEQGEAGNHRNGTSPRTVLTPNGELKLDIPRDRQATFEPQLVGKYQRRLPGFDDHVISMYARGMRAAPMVFERPQSGGALTCSRSTSGGG